ncbi:MAG: glycoside hydrolase family 13 protein [Desulfotomaculum sp.]|nr:glycoside hydrolase family 13 protein [Desulfotomaculum sp.]
MHQWIYHNSHDLYFRNPFGAVCCNTLVELKLEITSDYPIDSVVLRLWKDNSEERIDMHEYERKGNKVIYSAKIYVPSTPMQLWYFFIVYQGNRVYYYGNNPENKGGVGMIYDYEPPSFQITVYKEGFHTPNWFKHSVMYQIFVDRFYNNLEEGQLLNPKERCHIYYRWYDKPYYRTCSKTGVIVCFDFYGGNLLGVIEKLSYLKELGINVIYFNPIFEAPSNHKYDTANYKKIDSMYGNEEIFKQLCQKAKEMGIYIILDGVFSHTGSDSIYFNKEGTYPELGAYQSKESPYYSWYKFIEWPEKYECWWGIDTLPCVNELDPSYMRFIIYDQDSVLEYWMKRGAKGWRLDVVDELPDEFIKAFRKKMKEIDPDSVLIGEVWEDASNKISYSEMRKYLLGEELDSVMNYPFRKTVIDFFLGNITSYDVHKNLMSLYENYPLEVFYSTMNIVGSHDVPRILTILGEAPPEETLSREEQARYFLTEEKIQLAIDRLKLVSLFQMTFPGVPCIYYGDEAGVEGYSDPYCRATYPWGAEIKELLRWYKKVIGFRNKYGVLRTGQWKSLPVDDDIYGYVRIVKNNKDIFGQPMEDNTAIVLFNRNRYRKIDIGLELGDDVRGEFTNLLDDDEKVQIEGTLSISLMPLEAKLFMLHV